MKKIFYSVLFLMCLFLFYGQNALASEGTSNDFEDDITNDIVTNELELFEIPDTNLYPGTTIPMMPGDVLYSKKTLGGSTQIVGHVAIVGPDLKVYHSSPAGDGSGKTDSISMYQGRHDHGEEILVYRPKKGAPQAATWARNNIGKVKEYYINPLAKLSTISPNYCSKFVWQAFYFGSGIDLTSLYYNGDTRSIVTPSHIRYSDNMSPLPITTIYGKDW